MKHIVILFFSMTLLISCEAQQEQQSRPAAQVVSSSSYNVWMCHAYSMPKGRYSTSYIVWYSNNECLPYVPETGLLGVTKANSNQTNSWGIMKDKGSEWHLENAVRGTVQKIGKLSATEMVYPIGSKMSSYKKCKPVDGLLLEGEWSPQDPKWYNDAHYNKTCFAPVIAFHKDGTFYNKGLISLYNLKAANSNREFGGGTYQIKDYTLVLTYADGTVCHVSLTGFNSFDPRTDNELLFMRAIPYYKNLKR